MILPLILNLAIQAKDPTPSFKNNDTGTIRNRELYNSDDDHGCFSGMSNWDEKTKTCYILISFPPDSNEVVCVPYSEKGHDYGPMIRCSWKPKLEVTK